MYVYGAVFMFLLHRWLPFTVGSTTSTSAATTTPPITTSGTASSTATPSTSAGTTSAASTTESSTQTTATTTTPSITTAATSSTPVVVTTTDTRETAAYIEAYDTALEVIGYFCIALFFFCVPLICICDCMNRRMSKNKSAKSESVQQLKANEKTETPVKVVKKPPERFDIPKYDKGRHQQPIQTPIIEASLLEPKVPPRYKPSKTTSNGRNTAQPRYYTRVSNVT